MYCISSGTGRPVAPLSSPDFQTIGSPSPHLARPPSQEQILKLMGAWDPTRTQLGPGETARTILAEKLRESLGSRYRADLSRYSASEMLDSIEYFLFPNMCLFPGISLPMIYRFRPNGMDVDSCIHEILFLAPLPVPSTPEPNPDDSGSSGGGAESGEDGVDEPEPGEEEPEEPPEIEIYGTTGIEDPDINGDFPDPEWCEEC